MKFRVLICIECNMNEFEIGPVSNRGLCEACGIAHAINAAVQMRNKSGPAWDRWVGKMRELVAEVDRAGGS